MEKPKLPHAASYSDLIVYQKSRQLARDIFHQTARFPREETYSLIDQVRRSSRSVGAQIAEAWAKRRYEKSFISKLVDALGELYETQHWIDVAVDCQYLTQAQAKELVERTKEIARILYSMTEHASQFCHPPTSPTLREPSPIYINPPPDPD